ncbi:MAG: hypothetical protein IKQ63_08690 [Eubacterium sp.]|nr:hypothetical protein [Eubacterium sp.]
MYSFCLKLAGGSDPADDLYQDTWLYAVKTRDMMETRSILQSRWCILLHIIFSTSYLLKGLMTEQRWLRR